MLHYQSGRLYLGLLAVLVLSGCGGSSGGSGSEEAGQTKPASPDTLTLSVAATKQFRFNWSDVDGETGYRLLENRDGNSGYSEVATIESGEEAYELTVPLYARVNARYILQACNNEGCSDSSPVHVSGALAEAVGYVKASNTEAGDDFSYGDSIALDADGNTLAVGAYGEDSDATGINGDQSDNSASSSGAVYVFTRDGAVWSQQAYIKAANTDDGDFFGSPLALSADGNTLAVGANSEDSNTTGIGGTQSDNSAGYSGAAYVFTRSASTWSQQAYIKASNTDDGDLFGASIALSDDGDTLAVGAEGESSNATGIDGNQSDNSAAGSGAVYVFTRSNESWSQQAYVKATDTEAGDRFGDSVALAGNGDTLAVGAYGKTSSSGAVYVYTRSISTWSEHDSFSADNTEPNDQFGRSLALTDDGNTLVVGASYEDSNASGIGGDDSNNDASNSGAVYVFTRSGSTWSQQAYLKASNSNTGDSFGASVAISSDGITLSVGAYGESSNGTGVGGNQSDNSAASSGASYVFTYSNGVWSQQAYIKAANTNEDDEFGATLSLSGDGDTLAVGAAYEDSSATGIGGDQISNSASGSGAVYLY